MSLSPLVVGTAEAAPTCSGKRATKVGTDKGERLVGTKGPDVIVGRGGADRIRGLGGDDFVCAGKGSDLVFGGGGNDEVRGQSGPDALLGGPGNDSLIASSGPFEALIGGSGDDLLIGNAGFVLTSYERAPAGVVVDLEEGTATGGHGSDQLIDILGVEGSKFDDAISGDTGTNLIYGLDGNDTLSGGGNSGSIAGIVTTPPEPNQFDLLVGMEGDDDLTGGPGANYVAFGFSEAAVDVNLSTGRATGEGDDTLTGINVVIGSFHDDTITGDDQDNAIEGYGGADTIDGKAGQDVAAYSGASSGAVVDLTTGTATAQYLGFDPILTSDTSTDTLKAIEDVWGSLYADTLRGDQFANELRGLNGRDTLTGEAGDDTLVGGAGNDSADGGDGTDTCDAETTSNCEGAVRAPAQSAPSYVLNILNALRSRAAWAW